MRLDKIVKHSYTTIFSSEIKALVSEEKDKYLAMASLLEIGEFVPNVDTRKDFDLLPIAFNACVVNRVNKNGDVVDTPTAIAMHKNFINKPINIEHNRDRVVGVILATGFSEFGSDKILTEDEAKELKGPFNITLGGVVWKVVNNKLADMIENASDPTSEDYLKISASWELGFDKYNIVVLEGDEKNIETAKIIEEGSELEELKSSLKGFGGSGKLDNGCGVYRQVIDNVVPLGIGLTQTPAADVMGVATTRVSPQSQVVDSEEKSSKNKENSSHSAQKDVLINKEIDIMDKITKIEEITDESLKAGEISASVVTDFIENKLQEASEKFVAQKEETETKLKAAEESTTTLTEEHSKVKEEMAKLSDELDTLKAEQEAKAAEDKFNQRMASFDSEYELDDDHRSIIATDIKDMSDEDFDAYAKKMEVLLSRQKYGGNKGDIPDADRKKKGHHGKGPKRKETADEEGEVDWKKDTKASEETEKVVASATPEEQEATQLLEETLDNAEVEASTLPTTAEASEPTLADRYKNAFEIDNFEIQY